MVSGSWGLGWLTTWAIGVDVERGYAVFGSSGAVVVTSSLGWCFGDCWATTCASPLAPAVEAGA